MAVKKKVVQPVGSVKRLRLGFVSLIDAAPLIVAKELGYFADEHLAVELERQIGWGNVRDKLTFGRLDAAHALVGMPLFSHLARDWFVEPLVCVMNLGSGGNAITLSKRLSNAGVHSSSGLAEYIASDRQKEVLVFAHVFSCSMHHYLLREWLAAAGINPDTDVRLRIFPPSQMPENMIKGHLDGFCAGEPWNTQAALSGAGEIVAITTDIVPNHPEKGLVTSRRWAQQHAAILPKLIRALLRACAFCENENNTAHLAGMLAEPQYIEAPEDVILASMGLEKTFGAGGTNRMNRPRDWHLRCFAPQVTFPSATHSLWMLRQMIRWNQVKHELDERSIASHCVDSSAYREAAGSLGISCPSSDFEPMPLRTGTFDPDVPVAPQAERILEGVSI